ncbi:LANO_0F12574g1_1 [Lachancea nothofagi CBS 11611]|uniref:LANO_0F12574g1_1 n=1 Tax=Lachancea nothofagi CBS 11611 TaxID=1266666 RepID=A0A1G4KBE8_9SACH|nr:LANO_0F12574g1_1 [Lachancea nothofagi CBS 11611]
MSFSNAAVIRDDGPKLREEKHFADFYPDLDQQELLPIVAPHENKACDETDGQDGEGDGCRADESVGACVSIRKNADAIHVKQMIYNDKVTLEPITIKKDRVKYKKCKIRVSNLAKNSRVGKQYQKFGFLTGTSASKFDDLTSPYIKKTDYYAMAKQNPLGHISRYQLNFKVEYDMDEQDDLYLRYLNQLRIPNQKYPLTHEMFEIIMSVLENEWFYLEKKIPPRMPTTSDISTRETRAAWAHFEAYASDDGTGHVIDQPCAVCGGTECDNSNAIVFCDGCDVAVHQECYGVVFIPEGQWLCRRCMISRNRKINCLFCPSHTGAFKQTDRGSWGHVICGIWISELFFVNSHYMEPIEGIDLIPRSRWRLTCYICKQKVGACIQCCNKNCFTAYHVTCAKRAGLCMDFGSCSIVEASSNAPGINLQSFCDKHSPPEWPDCKSGILKTRNYFAAVASDAVAIESNSEKRPNILTKGRWTTNRGTPIAPHLFAHIVQQVLDLFKIENSSKVSTDLCKYWSMKRELKRGAPLVRKFDPSSLGAFTVEELNQRVQFAHVLSKDLDRLRALAGLLVDRQTAAQLRNRATAKAWELYNYPGRFILREAVIKRLNNFSSYRALMQEKKTREDLSNQIKICLEAESDDYITLFKETMTEFFARLESDAETTRRIQVEARKLQTHIHALLETFNGAQINSCLEGDFTIEEGQIKAVPWKGPSLMKHSQLEEVQKLSQAEIRILRGLLGNF